MTLAFSPPPCPDSPLRRIDARWKLAALTLALVAAACLRTLPATAAAFAAALLLAAIARLPIRWMLQRWGFLLLFLSPFALSLPLLAPDWNAGLMLALFIILKALTLTTLALTMVASSPMADTLAAAHALRVPGILVQMLALTFRYAFLLAGELRRLRVALQTRGFRPRPSLHCYRTLGSATGMMLVRGHERGERVAQAMRSRGFDGRWHSLAAFRTSRADLAFFLLVSTLAAALLAWDLHERALPSVPRLGTAAWHSHPLANLQHASISAAVPRLPSPAGSAGHAA